jgi:phosphoribosyl 1,2-cyclic phosphodiesterase
MISNLIFWGVRGSFPIASREMIKYGGNTSCLSLQLDADTILVFDAGSGLKNLGDQILKTYKNSIPEIHVLVSHFMWDHIMGIPFFAPLNTKDAKIHFYSPERDDHLQLKDIFSLQHSRDYFHVDFVELAGNLSFNSVGNYKPFKIGSAKITPVRLNHADITYGYIVEFLGKKIAYITDTAPFENEYLGSLPNPKYSKAKYMAYLYDNLKNHLMKCDILYIDSHWQYEEYKLKHNWGHSYPEFALLLASECKIKNVFLTHHAPEHSDVFIDKMVSEASMRAGSIRVIGAKENMMVKIVDNK